MALFAGDRNEASVWRQRDFVTRAVRRGLIGLGAGQDSAVDRLFERLEGLLTHVAIIGPGGGARFAAAENALKVACRQVQPKRKDAHADQYERNDDLGERLEYRLQHGCRPASSNYGQLSSASLRSAETETARRGGPFGIRIRTGSETERFPGRLVE